MAINKFIQFWSSLDLILSDVLPHDVGDGRGDQAEVELDLDSKKFVAVQNFEFFVTLYQLKFLKREATFNKRLLEYFNVAIPILIPSLS